MKHRKTGYAAVAVGCLLMTGCALLAPVRDQTQFFTLNTMPAAQAGRANEPPQGAAPTRALLYMLGPIRLPAYLDRNEVATRDSPTRLTYSNTDRWAEPLVTNVAAVLLQNLSALLATDRIVPYPALGVGGVDYQVEINFLRFETDTAGRAHLVAHWGVRDVATARYVLARDTRLTRPGTPGDPTAAVAALSATLEDFSDEIASALRTLPAPREAPPSRPSP